MSENSSPASGLKQAPDHSSGLVRAFAASLTGTALEWYDFAVYSASAALIFPLIFFPGERILTRKEDEREDQRGRC